MRARGYPLGGDFCCCRAVFEFHFASSVAVSPADAGDHRRDRDGRARGANGRSSCSTRGDEHGRHAAQLASGRASTRTRRVELSQSRRPKLQLVEGGPSSEDAGQECPPANPRRCRCADVGAHRQRLTGIRTGPRETPAVPSCCGAALQRPLQGPSSCPVLADLERAEHLAVLHPAGFERQTRLAGSLPQHGQRSRRRDPRSLSKQRRHCRIDGPVQRHHAERSSTRQGLGPAEVHAAVAVRQRCRQADL
jgi:hypothetical protein